MDSDSDCHPLKKKRKTGNKSKTVQEGKDKVTTTALLQVSNNLPELLTTHQQIQIDNVEKDHNQMIENDQQNQIVCDTGTGTQK